MAAIPPEELEIRIPGLRLAARAWGARDAAPVLAIHGWQDNAASFDLLAPRLAGLRIVALDLPGHGRSAHRPDGAGYSFLDWVVDCEAVADALGWERFAFLGHSLGAAIANAFAGTWPARVERIAAIDGLAPRLDVPDAAPAQLAAHVAERRRAERAPPRRFADVEAAAARLGERMRGLPPDGARLLAGRGTVPLAGGGVTWSRDARIPAGPPLRLGREQMRAFLVRVRCPVLVVRPRDGWPISAAEAERLLGWLADVEVREIDGGHHVHLERPAEVASLVGAFLRGGV